MQTYVPEWYKDGHQVMPTISIYLSAWSSPQYGNFAVTIDPSDVTGLRDHSGGVLQFPVSVQPEDCRTEQAVIALEGWLRSGHDDGTVLGIHAPLQTISPNYHYLRFPVTQTQLAYIEARRAGGEALLSLTMAGLANVPIGPVPDDQAHSPAAFTRPIRDNGSGVTIMIPQQQWLKALRDMGYGEIRILELPALSSKAISSQWSECVRLLTRATDEHRTGTNETAMASCRLVVEGLVVVIAQQWCIVRRPGQSFEGWLKEVERRMSGAWPEDAGAAKVLTAVYLAVWQWTSESHHYRSRIPLHHETALVLGLTADLLAFAAQLLLAHSEPIKQTAASAFHD